MAWVGLGWVGCGGVWWVGCGRVCCFGDVLERMQFDDSGPMGNFDNYGLSVAGAIDIHESTVHDRCDSVWPASEQNACIRC